nr:MAG TPA: terminase small subunit [Caudoviricetes sp.]
MGISVKTLFNWKTNYLPILQALKKGKEVVDYEVENALLQKALGMTKVIQKPFKLKEVKYENGKRISEKERIEYAEEEVFIPPDTTAQIFWLKNRRPDKWRDKSRDEADTTTLDRLDNILNEIKEDAIKSTKNNAVHD